MRKIIILLLNIIFLTSCVSTQVSTANNYDYSVLKKNKIYRIDTKDDVKYKGFQFIQETEKDLIGKYQDKEIKIEKENIEKVLKISAGKTALLTIPIIATAILVPSYIKNKPVGQ